MLCVGSLNPTFPFGQHLVDIIGDFLVPSFDWLVGSLNRVLLVSMEDFGGGGELRKPPRKWLFSAGSWLVLVVDTALNFSPASFVSRFSRQTNISLLQSFLVMAERLGRQAMLRC